MKALVIIILLAIIKPTFGQILCETSGICSNVDDDKQFEEQPSILIERSAQKLESYMASGKHVNIECAWPTFWNWNAKDPSVLIVLSAEAVGSSIEILNRSFANHAKFVPIRHQGQVHAAATRFGDGEPVFIDGAFLVLLTKLEYHCYGLPLEPTRYIKCKRCGKIYAMQRMKLEHPDGTSETTTYFLNANNCGMGGNCDNINLGPLPECPCLPGIQIKSKPTFTPKQ